jgi:hypothetical protein
MLGRGRGAGEDIYQVRSGPVGRGGAGANKKPGDCPRACSIDTTESSIPNGYFYKVSGVIPLARSL